MRIPLSLLLSFLEEDAPFGDLTSDAVVPGLQCSAEIQNREEGVIAGLEEAESLFSYLGVKVHRDVQDGDAVPKGTSLLRLEGPATAILLGERTALNILGRMSGIATRTRSLVVRVRSLNARCRVATTRKTAPGLRLLDKKAVLVGGGETHRFSLSDMILIKDNHLALVPITEAIARASERHRMHRIEVEVSLPADAVTAAKAGADVVMLDNMTPAMVADTLTLLQSEGLRKSVLIEVSGRITEENIQDYAIQDIDLISLGALTHSVRNLDISLEVGKQTLIVPATQAPVQKEGVMQEATPAQPEKKEVLSEDEIFSRLLQYLQEGSLNARWRAAEALGERGDPRAVPYLIKALSDPFEDVQWLAVQALGKIKDPSAVPALIEALKGESKWLRQGAAWSLGKIGDKQAVEPLIQTLKDPKKDVRKNAAWALGRIGDPRAIPPLQEVAKTDPEEKVKKEATEALTALEKVNKETV